jgi:dihydroneopterin aldolase
VRRASPANIMDIIFIRDLRLTILVGIYAWEREVPQSVRFDLEIGLRDARAAKSDAINDTIDYAKVVERIEASLQDNTIQLLEKLAEHIAALIMGEFKAPWVRVSVTKLSALRNVKELGVCIERGTRTP